MEDRGFYDVYDVCAQPLWLQKSFQIICCCTIVGLVWAVLCAFFLIYRWLTVDRSPWSVALVALERLQKKSGQSGVDIEGCYVRLTSVLRTYLQQRYGVVTVANTEHESIHLLAMVTLSPVLLSMAQEILLRSAEVKFARHSVGEEQLKSDLDRAVEFVRRAAENPLAIESE